MITLSLFGDLAEVDGLLRTVLYACAAGYALVTEYDSLAGISDIVHRADLCACSAHDALVVCLQGLTLHAGYLDFQGEAPPLLPLYQTHGGQQKALA